MDLVSLEINIYGIYIIYVYIHVRGKGIILLKLSALCRWISEGI